MHHFDESVFSGRSAPQLRLGLLVPSSNTIAEREFSRALPSGVSVHSARMPIVNTCAEELEKMSGQAEKAALLLATARVDIICYACTTGSLLKGRQHDQDLSNRIEKATGIRTIATAPAVAAALHKLNVRKLVAATPYIEELNLLEKQYLEEYGFELLEIRGLGILSNIEIGRCPPSCAYQLGLDLIRNQPEAEALFISCTNFRTWEIIKPLSQEIGKPVISSNQATLWKACESLGISGDFWALKC